MKKLFTLRTWIFTLCFLLGAAIASAADPVYTLSFEKLTTGTNYNSYTAGHTITCGGVDWDVWGNQSVGNNLRVGGKNTTATKRTLTSKSPVSSDAISKVILHHEGIGNGKGTSITVNSITVEGSVVDGFTNAKTKTITNPTVSSAGTLEFALDDGEWLARSYFKITVNYQVQITSGSTANNSYLTITSVDFYKSEGGQGKKLKSISVKTPPTKTTYFEGEKFNPSGLAITAYYDTNDAEDITYAGNESKFSFNPSLDVALTTSNTSVDITYGEKTASQAITVNEAVKYDVTIANNIVNGTVSANVTEAPEGAEVTLTATPAEGYKFGAWDVKDASNNTIAVSDNKFTMPAANVTVSATFVEKPATVEDYIVADDLNATGSSYTDFSNVKKNTAVYAGQSAKGNDVIQLRSTNPSGIVSTTSGGKIKKVVVTWNSNTASGRTLDVYANNDAYKSSADLYDSAKRGTKIGTIVYGTSAELEISDDYTYVGVRSNSGAMYLDGIKFVWDTTPEQVKTLDHITLSGTYQTTFNVGDTFNHEGMTVTASYAEEGVADADVTNLATFSGYDMSQAGTQTVTVSYTEGEVTKTATYTITIKKKSARAYTLVTSQDDIVDGGEYIILSEDGNYAAAVGTNNRIETEARGENTYKIVDNTVIVSSYSITRPYFLVATDNTDNTDKGWYLNDGEYNASLSEKTHVDFVKDKQDVFTVSIAADNTAKITAPAVAADRQIAYHYWIKQNTTDVVERAFRYYASSKVGTADYQAIKLYKRVNTVVIEDGYRSKYNESTERNLYKNTLTYDVPKANDELKLYRGTTLLGTFTVDATNENYTFTPENAFDADQTNRFDDEPVVLTGNADNGLTITDYYSEFIEANMPEAVRYSLRDADDVEVGVAVVPLYRSVASARVMMDPANNIEGYTADDIVNDNAHAANYQNNVRVDVAHADIDGLSGIKVYRDHVVAGEAGATAEYVDVLGKEVRLSNIFESELAVTSAYGENTYGSPKATVHAALVAIEAHDKEVSKYSFTTAGGKTGHYFSVLADVKLNQPEDGEFELVGVRAWRTCNSSLEPIEQLAGRSNDYNYATILDTETFAAIEGNEVKNIGSEKISYEDAGTKLEFGSGVFGSFQETPTVALRVRAYYRRVAQSSAAPMMKAPAAAGNYYVAEAFAEVTFNADVITGVLDVAGAKEVKSVRYFNIMGVESAEPVDGVNIVVTTYTDGTSSSAKMLR